LLSDFSAGFPVDTAFLELLLFFVDWGLGAGFLELDLGLVVVFKVEAGALVETETFLEETLEDTETFLEDTEALTEECLDETDALIEECLDETEGFWGPWGPLEGTVGLGETEALVEEALAETLEETETFLEETLAETELFFEETEALIEECFDETDACLEETLEETEGLGPTLEETDAAELWLDAALEEVDARLVIGVAEWLRVDDAVMVLFMPTLVLISIGIGYEIATTYMGAFMGRPAALICALAWAWPWPEPGMAA
jgi:hypothetical protein